MNGDYLPTSPTSVIPAQAGIHLLQGAPSRLRKQSITPPSQNRWVNLGPHIPHLRHCRAEPAPYSDTVRESIGDYLLAASRAAVWHAPMGKIKRWWSILVGVRGGCLDCWDAWHLSSRWERCHLAGSDGCSRLGSRKWSHRYDPSGVAGCLVGGLLSYQQAPPRSLEPIRLARSRDRKLDRQVHNLLKPPLHRLASDFGATLWRGGPAKLASRLLWLRALHLPRGDFPTMTAAPTGLGRTPPFQ